MVYTLAFLTRPKPGITEDEFFVHYRDVHRPLAQKLPGLLAYRQTRIRKDGFRGADAGDYAAYSEYTFNSEQDAAVAWRSPEGIALDEDTGRFMDWPSVLTLPLTELGTFMSEHKETTE
ncbi:EthD domain-containing protein [Saccharopolyspora mangrovi]|uniref:EthD domain-containing protein n=1 Tax=Saccharopolyspora mangrovi TaxID=3082379 RepID=A0ABU6AJJ2_9PSEU|nr:EthD domain-containing protein [Saccharopolyspora sp. S2-29]MEB3371726.1 EthD domain-containing protein [Saccharopolyspora sp. S2-29]